MNAKSLWISSFLRDIDGAIRTVEGLFSLFFFFSKKKKIHTKHFMQLLVGTSTIHYKLSLPPSCKNHHLPRHCDDLHKMMMVEPTWCRHHLTHFSSPFSHLSLPPHRPKSKAITVVSRWHCCCRHQCNSRSEQNPITFGIMLPNKVGITYAQHNNSISAQNEEQQRKDAKRAPGLQNAIGYLNLTTWNLCQSRLSYV